MYTCVMNFRDENMPKMRAGADTEALAFIQVDHWSRTFAGVSSFAVFTPDGDKLCFDQFGRYWFTVPAEACRANNIHP